MHQVITHLPNIARRTCTLVLFYPQQNLLSAIFRSTVLMELSPAVASGLNDAAVKRFEQAGKQVVVGSKSHLSKPVEFQRGTPP